MKNENKKIALLPSFISNRIAAGEVIERPSSLVKELIENSIDANAKEINVEIEDGGRSVIVISDNGDGIVFDDLPLAVAHHATSKIKTIEDLNSIYTLGFRGEALASIADVARLEIRSKNRFEKNGGYIVSEGGEIKMHTPYPISKGTTIIVNNLFYNLPARYKFLKHPAREFIAIKDVFDSFVIANFGISFSLKNNGKTVCSYKAKENVTERLFDYYGETAKHFVEIEDKRDGIYIYGFVSDMNALRHNRKDMYIYLNGRIIENKIIMFAVKNAYKGVIPSDRFPYSFIYISIDSEKVDINVHPSKKEVRMKEEREIASLIYKVIMNAVHKKSLFSNRNEEVAPQKSFGLGVFSENSVESGLTNLTLTAKEEYDDNESFKNSDDEIESSFVNEVDSDKMIASERVEFGEECRVVGQIFSSYIVAQRAKEMLIIDQHAAYERLNYEIMYKKISGGKLEYEELLVALEFHYRDYEIDLLMSAKDVFFKIGIDFERRSKDSLVIDRLPLYFKNASQNERVVKEMLDSFISEDKKNLDIDKFIRRSLQSAACKYSPKANDMLSREEMQKLIDMLEKENILTSCPHGRPFVIKMDRTYLDKKFFRY